MKEHYVIFIRISFILQKSVRTTRAEHVLSMLLIFCTVAVFFKCMYTYIYLVCIPCSLYTSELLKPCNYVRTILDSYYSPSTIVLYVYFFLLSR